MNVPKPKNLLKRVDRYYGRVAVPRSLRDLRESAGQPNPAEIVRSLGTPDRRIAERLLPSFLDQCYREFEREEEQLRSQGAKPLAEATAEDLAIIRRQFFWDTLRDNELERTLRTTPSETAALRERLCRQIANERPESLLELVGAPGFLECIATDQPPFSVERRAFLKKELTTHLAQSEYVLVASIIEGYAQAHGLRLEPGSVQYKSLARGLIKEWIKALEIAEQHDKGIYDPRYDIEAFGAEEQVPARTADAQVINLAEERVKHPRKGKRLRDCFDSYLKECKPGLRSNAKQDHWATLRQFVECNGDKAVNEYGRSDMSEFKKALKKYPANAARIYPDITFKRVLESNRSDGHPTLSSNTVRSKLSVMSAFGKWMEENVDGVDASNFATTLPKRHDRRRMEPFTDDEVRRILNSYAFIGCESDKNYSKLGKFQLRDWHFWFTLIAAFTGARVNEIMQMDVTDLREEKGVLVFSFTDEDDGKSLKTNSSRRLVPVHPQLVELGLLAYRDKLAAKGSKSLFDDAPIKDGRRAKQASSWFRKFLHKTGVKKQGKLGGAHRWRHTLADALRRADVEEYDIALVLGHKIDIARMTRHYGRELSMSLERRREILSKVEYPEVDFTLLMP